jgi:hypothetical protein
LTLLARNHACSICGRTMNHLHGIPMDAINELRLALARGASCTLIFRNAQEHTQKLDQEYSPWLRKCGYC